MEIGEVLTRAQMKRLKRNMAIREKYRLLINNGFKVSQAIHIIAEEYELSDIMVRLIIRKKTAL